jgi:alpha-L-fucosidase
VLHPNDVASLMAFRDLRAERFIEVNGRGNRASSTAVGAGRQLEVRLTTPVRIAAVRLEESIENGQSVARFSVHGEESSGWRELARGTTVGYARIERFTPVAVSAIRVVVEEAIAPVPMPTIRIFAAS